MFPAAVIWLVVAAGAGVGAARRRTVVPVPALAGALFSIVTLALGGGFVASCFIFVTVTLIGRWAVRPMTRPDVAPEPRVSAGLGSIVGMPAVVVERISNDEALGCVRIAEELWSARSPEGERAIETGERVHVVEVRGSTAIVSR